jgi:putative two-component system response regulator
LVAKRTFYRVWFPGRQLLRNCFMAEVACHLGRKKVAPRVLVVDNESHARTTVCRWLTRAGFECEEAASATDAMARLQSQEAHLLTLDITVPDRSGLEVLSQIKQRWPDTEVLVLTALEETAAAVEAMTLGAYGYLLKPVKSGELLLQARKALERRSLVVERRQYTATLEAKVREQMQAIRRAHEETILRLLSASRYRDEETGAHIKRTGLYCEVFAEVLGWPAEQVQNIRLAAPMHDLGKIGIPDAILKKPGKLTPEEFEVMKTHTRIGARMLEGSGSTILQMAHEIALAHHERWEGSGYPLGLAGLQIPESARILAIVDVYDALTHRRVYHEAVQENAAIEIMEPGRGKHFDPFLFGIFLSLLPEMRRIALENPDDRATNCVSSAVEVLPLWPEIVQPLCAAP